MSNQESTEIKAPRRVRVKNDGGPGYATKVTDADTGQPIDYIYHVKVVDIDVHDTPRVLMWAHNPIMDITGIAETTNVCPFCKAQKNVEPTEDNKEVWKHRIKIDIDDTDVAYSIQRLRDLQWQHDEFMRESIGPAEAIHAFMAWRESRDETMPCDDDAKLIEKFCQAQGWYVKNEKYAELIRDVMEDGQVAILHDDNDEEA
jgi:hypothetical protein